ncbi:MAG: hypothetical protein IJI37_01520, partial [Opitutales bacterium]|nr:hypothetical protein [Opitutales bacterium]
MKKSQPKRKKRQDAPVSLTDEQAWEFLQGSTIHAKVVGQCPNKRFWRAHAVGAIAGGEFDFCGIFAANARAAKNLYKNKVVAVEPTPEFPYFV